MFRNIKSGACQMTEITKVSNCSQMVYMPQMLKYTVLSLVLSKDMQLHCINFNVINGYALNKSDHLQRIRCSNLSFPCDLFCIAVTMLNLG